MRLRSVHRLKLADALIAATATSLNLPLVTSDKGFARLKDEVDLKWL
ncbi:MAG: PIN domain-containing protein [Flavobacteriales bacterium]